ncbi:hypothetical protein J6590_041368 [Homalodisca vitripennis]|nr:hypothetical protein J6590_041368 [Homalodisca vitripennis]
MVNVAQVRLPLTVAADAVADLTPTIWSHVQLKGYKKSGVKEDQNELFASFDITDIYTTKYSVIYVKRYSHCLIRCTVECTTMSQTRSQRTVEVTEVTTRRLKCDADTVLTLESGSSEELQKCWRPFQHIYVIQLEWVAACQRGRRKLTIASLKLINQNDTPLHPRLSVPSKLQDSAVSNRNSDKKVCFPQLCGA